MENKKLVIAKELLASDKEDLQMWQDILDNAPNKYVGKTLEREMKQSQKFCEEYRIIVDALEKYIKDTEDFDKFDAEQSRLEAMSQEGVETTETKVANELLNEPQ